jgi:tetratricopeptide (TPR) repeat protein
VRGEPIDNRETEDQELWNKLPHTEGEERAELLIQLAQQAIYRSSGSEALAFAEEAHEIYKAMGARASSVAMANAITGISYSLKELNRVDEATKAIDGAIDLLRENGYPFVVDTMRTKATWFSEMKRWEEALNTYLDIIKINEIDGHAEFVGRDLFQVAHCDWQKVIENALKAREIFKSEKMIFEISWCDLNIADAHAELGDGLAAIEWGRRAHDVGTLRKDNEVICKASYVMARGHIALEQYQEAENYLTAAQDLVARSNDWTQIQKIEKALICVYRSTGREEEANEAERRLGTLQEIVE